MCLFINAYISAYINICIYVFIYINIYIYIYIYIFRVNPTTGISRNACISKGGACLCIAAQKQLGFGFTRGSKWFLNFEGTVANHTICIL